MFRIITVLLAAGSLCAQPAGQRTERRSASAGQTSEPGSLRGTVVGPSGEPLRKAEVTVRAVGGRGGSVAARPGMMMPGFAGGISSQTTDASGTFHFNDLAPGQYAVTVQRNGFVRFDGARPGNRPGTGLITVSSGQTATGITIRLIPQGVISGKITDEDGDPVAFVSVQVMRERWAGGRRQFTPQNADSTNDLGEYRIAGLMPGKYFLMVNYSRPEAGRPQPRPAGAVADQMYAALFYPGVAEIGQATPVHIESGQELRGMDLQMRKTATFRVRGRVLDESGKPVQGVSVMAAPAEGYFLGMRAMSVVRDTDGSFEIAGVQPGSYTLIANRGGREGARSVARSAIQVGARDLDGVTIQLQPTFEISGVVRAPEGVAVANTRVTLESLETTVPFGAMGSSGPVDEAGAWKAAGISAGKYRFALSPMPQGAYLKAVVVQGQDITAGAAVGSAANGVEIQIGSGAPTVSGTATGASKEPAEGATVILVPEAARREQYWLFRQTSADANGSFTLSGMPPGQYTAYAFTEVEDGAWFSPDFLRSVEGKGVAVKLAEGSTETIQVTVAQ